MRKHIHELCTRGKELTRKLRRFRSEKKTIVPIKTVPEMIRNFVKTPGPIPSAKRIFSLAASNMWRNKFLSVSTVLVISLILFSFNIILAINNAGKSVIDELNKKVDIILYLKDETSVFQAERLIKELETFPDIQEIHYTSKENALKKFLEEYADRDNPFAKYGLTNKLPANIQIITKTPENHPEIMNFLSGGPFENLLTNIESDKENLKIAEKLAKIDRVTQKIMWGIILTFIVGGILIIQNSISLTLYSRRTEIKIMSLVGANHYFIRLPFIVEGAVYGLLSAVISAVLLIVFLQSTRFGDIDIPRALEMDKMAGTLSYEMIMSMFIGIISSQIAIHQYFKRKKHP